MNIRKLFSWNNSDAKLIETPDSQNQLTNSIETPGHIESNVISLPSPQFKNSQELSSTVATPESVTQPPHFKGLMNVPELNSFFSENYFGLGCHNGANFRTQDALELGRKSLISKFQNILTDLLECKQAKVNKIESQLIAIEGLSDSMTEQLKLACKHIEREISILRDQIDAAGSRQGWILEALNKYHIGYIKGLNDAIQFEFLAG